MQPNLRPFYEARPFKPFEIVFDDGRKVRIDDPINIGFSDHVVFFATQDGSHDVLPIGRMKEIHLAPYRRSRPLRNGRSRRRGKR